MTDLELVHRCMKGDRTAQQALWKSYSGKMYAVCRRYFDHEEDAQDALQESFIKVYGRLDQWRGQGPLGAWIRRIAVNTSLNLIKSKAHQKTWAVDEAETLSDPNADAISQLGEEEVIKLIQSMPIGYRTVFNLFAIEGFSHQEIADTLGVTESTSKTQYLKAKNWLKHKLETNTTHHLEKHG
ncbi:MAG: RNA polymerase sigma factor [Flavobacteriales bacterium]|jgi:RNA polymerase sigma factor (sigma-70 family)